MSSLHPVAGSADDVLALLREMDRADDPPPLAIETSGSTGRPKRVLLSRAALRASARATHTRLGGPGRWVLNLPPTYVAGLQVLFRSLRAGTEPLLAPDRSFANLPDLTRVVAEAGAGPTYLSLVPTQLHRYLSDPSQTGALARLDAVLVGGGPTREADLRAARRAGVRVVRTYGMSETCGGCVYDGVPLDGVEVRVDARDRVLLRGPVLFDGYAGEPERTAAALEDGWFVTHDLGRMRDGALELLGREDDVVISGGVKVPAGAVARMLREHPDVGEAAVIGVPDLEWGERVVAVLDAAVPLAELRDRVEPRTWAPRQVVVRDSLPHLASGKPDLVRLREEVRAALGTGALS